MWKFLPSDCNCNETPTNPNSSVCNHNGLTTDDLVYDGENLSCSGINNQDNISVAFQELDYFICGIELTQHILDMIQDNPQEYSEFIAIINGAINCETIIQCGPPPPSTTTTTSSSTSTSTSTTTSTSSSTTTTTTTVALACINYTIESILNDASWTALNCEGVPVGGIIISSGTTVYTGCILNTSLTLVNAIVITGADCATTTTTTTVLDCSFTGDADEITTTTTTSSSTSTSTSTTTTSTTTLPPPPQNCYLIQECGEGFYDDAPVAGQTFVVGNTVQYIREVEGYTTIHCGVIQLIHLTIPHAFIYGSTTVLCGDTLKCNIPNPSPPLPDDV